MYEKADRKIKGLEEIKEDFRRQYDQISNQISHADAVESLSVMKAVKMVEREEWLKMPIKTKRKVRSL